MQLRNFNATPAREIPYFIPGKKGPRPRTIELTTGHMILPGRWRALVLVSDLQGRVQDESGTWRLVGHLVAEELAAMADAGILPRPFAVLIAGDLWSDPGLRRMGGLGDVTPVWEAFANVADRVFGVLGNHDTVCLEELDRMGAALLCGNVIEDGDLSVGGVSGIIGNPRKPNRLPEAAYVKQLARVLRDSPDIVITHQGPSMGGPHDKGSSVIGRVFQERPGLVHVSGHCRWPTPMVDDGRNVFFNVDARCVILFSEAAHGTIST